MQGFIEIDRHNGNVIEATLESEKKQKIADCVTSILQDVAAYMRQSGAQNFQHVTLMLDANLCVQIYPVGTDRIKAIV